MTAGARWMRGNPLMADGVHTGPHDEDEWCNAYGCRLADPQPTELRFTEGTLGQSRKDAAGGLFVFVAGAVFGAALARWASRR